MRDNNKHIRKKTTIALTNCNAQNAVGLEWRRSSKWLEFREEKGKPKTKVFTVWGKCSDCLLGIIKWHPAWRHYCFFPRTGIETVHSDRCLLEISQFITELNQKHKEVQRARRELRKKADAEGDFDLMQAEQAQESEEEARQQAEDEGRAHEDWEENHREGFK